MSLGEWINPVAIATFVLAIVTAVLAFAAFRSITENRRMRAEDRELESKRRRLDEVQHWINEVLRIKAESASETDDPSALAERREEVRLVLSNKEYIKLEAGRLDFEFIGDFKLRDHIGRLSHILEYTTARNLSLREVQQELETKCVEVLAAIASIRAMLKL